MLDAIPDMRDALATADTTELAEIFDAFDVTATYDKPSAIAGAGFEPATFGL